MKWLSWWCAALVMRAQAVGGSLVPISGGTTLVAARWGNSSMDGGVVLGADSRTSRGPLVSNRLADKLTPLSPFVVVARSGSAADSQRVVAAVKHQVARQRLELGDERWEHLTVQAAAQLLALQCYEGKDSLSVSLLCAGWDRSRGAQIFVIPPGGSLVPAPASAGYALGGSGSAFVLGWCDAVWRPGMTRAECIEFVDHALQMAVARDGSSGGARQIVVLDETGTQRHVRRPESPGADAEVRWLE